MSVQMMVGFDSLRVQGAMEDLSQLRQSGVRCHVISCYATSDGPERPTLDDLNMIVSITMPEEEETAVHRLLRRHGALPLAPLKYA